MILKFPVEDFICLRPVDRDKEFDCLLGFVKMYALLMKSTWHNHSFAQTLLGNIQREALLLGEY